MSTIKELVDAVYGQPKGGAGGGLHIVLDDGNVNAGHILWCIDNKPDYRPEGLTKVEMKCAKALLKLTQEEREELYESGWERS